MKSDLYLHFCRSKVIERFDKSFKVKFSTYIFRCVSNYILAYYNTVHYLRKNSNNISIDDYTDSFFKKDYSKKKLMLPSFNTFEKDLNLKMDLAKIELSICKKKRMTGHLKSQLFKALEGYREGLTDKDLAFKMDMSVAGIGVLKKKLRVIVGEIVL